jgi:hypothetical protein
MSRRVDFSGVITREIFLRASTLAMGPVRWRYLAVCTTLAIIPVTYNIYRARILLGPTKAVLFGLFVLALFAALFVAVARSLTTGRKRALTELYDRTPGYREPVRGFVADDGLHLRTIHDVSDLPWDQFTRRVDAPDMVLLYSGPGGFRMLPREFFATDRDWDLARSIIEENLHRMSR